MNYASLKDKQIADMIELQDKINTLVDPNWTVKNNNWLLAGAMELAEAIDHHGWKWWKKQEMNLPMLQNELIDYWHFVLSKSIELSDGRYDKALNFVLPLYHFQHSVVFDDKNYYIPSLTLVEKLFLLIGLSASGKFNYSLFNSIMGNASLSWDELYKQYVGKNTLNIFRQENGYKTGEYFKTWNGKEDNYWMLDLINNANIDDPQFKEKIYDGLKALYSSFELSK